MPLSQLLQAVSPERQERALRRLASLDRETLRKVFCAAFQKGCRVSAYMMALELTNRSIPPSFWHEHWPADGATVNQKCDLLVFDLHYLSHHYRDHYSTVRYPQLKALWAGGGDDIQFVKGVEFQFYEGRRAAWKHVRAFSLTERMQWDCVRLRSVPVKKRHAATEAKSARVLEALRADLRTARRTSSYTSEDAITTGTRRHALWRCSRMSAAVSPTETAVRYQQLTGEPIIRQTVAKQLEKVAAALRKAEMTNKPD